jgi:lysophospholipase L1-like esterase
MIWRRVRELLLPTLISVALFLVLGELAIRVYLMRHTFYDVEMSRYARALKIDADNPLVGHVHRPSQELELMDVTVRINSAGFRDDEYPLEKGARWRIVFLGDSLTFGWGVEKEQSFEHWLERELDARRATEIINFAAGNYNTVQEVNLFLEKGLAYDPDQVVLFYFINDAEPVPRRSRFPWLGNVRVVTFYWSRIKALLARLDPQAGGFQTYYSALYAPDAEGWRRSRGALMELRDACRARDIALQVVLLPELHELVDYPFAREHAQVATFLRSNGVPALDLAPAFANEKDPTSLWVAPDDAHPNARAHEQIGLYSLAFIAGARGS